jgi:hypothetical protein
MLQGCVIALLRASNCTKDAPPPAPHNKVIIRACGNLLEIENFRIIWCYIPSAVS